MTKKGKPNVRCDGLLEEYKSLRTEIMKRQDARLYIVGFTMAAIGTVVGLTLKEDAAIGYTSSNYYVEALIAFALVVLNAALVLTIQYTQQIETIAGYITKFIEPRVAGMGWQTRWARYRKWKRIKEPTFLNLSLSTSSSLALFYALLSGAVYLVMLAKGSYHLVSLIFVSILAASSFGLSYDLFKKKTKGWKIKWNMIRK